jgi:hypothetical protein
MLVAWFTPELPLPTYVCPVCCSAGSIFSVEDGIGMSVQKQLGCRTAGRFQKIMFLTLRYLSAANYGHSHANLIRYQKAEQNVDQQEGRGWSGGYNSTQQDPERKWLQLREKEITGPIKWMDLTKLIYRHMPVKCWAPAVTYGDQIL